MDGMSNNQHADDENNFDPIYFDELSLVKFIEDYLEN